MGIEATKLELIQLVLHTQKESLLSKLKRVFEEEQTNTTLRKKDYQMMDKRREAHLKGERNSFTWKEVKQDARNAVR